MKDQGIRLQLLIGPSVPVTAPYEVVDALNSVEVTDRDHEQDGFQMVFSIGKDSLLDYSLLAGGLLDPPSRVIIVVFINAFPSVLIDGLITQHQVQPSNQPGQSRLTVTGVDISLQLDLEDKNATHERQPDSTIVNKILTSYGLVPAVTTTTSVPDPKEQIPTQQETDLRCVKRLAERNGFVFYVEPTDTPMMNRAYWGPDQRDGSIQGALTMNMGAATNVDRLDFTFDALRPQEPTIEVIDAQTGSVTTIPIPSEVRPPLAAQPAKALRKTYIRDAAGLSQSDGSRRMREILTQSWDAVDARGELDAVQYGGVLRACQLVAVRGAGQLYDGTYYVKQVTHNIRRGEYRQGFSLTREGRGATGLQVGT
jgi:hypothetical protein